MPFSGSGLGTEINKYKITSFAQFQEMENYPGEWFQLENNIDAAGARVRQFTAKLECNGFSVLNIGGAENEFSQARDNIIFGSGIVQNGELNFNWSHSVAGMMAPFGGSDNGGFQNLKISGTITNTNASGNVCGFCEFLADNQLFQSDNILITAHLSAHVNIVGAVTTVQNSGYANRIIFAGQMTDLSAGTATKYGISNTPFNSSRLRSCFWDTQLSGAATSNGGTGKTTAELQTLTTYTSEATTGINTGYAYDMVLESNYVDETWFLPSGMYPRLSFEDKTIATIGPITKDGVVQSGVVVQVTAYDDYTMATGKQVVGNYVTDANGIASIPITDMHAGKKIFISPHLNDTGTTSSAQGKFVSDVF